jgi:hypothetical protein
VPGSDPAAPPRRIRGPPRGFRREAAIAFDEFRGELGEEAEHVVDHQDLPSQAGEHAQLSATSSTTNENAPASAIAPFAAVWVFASITPIARLAR